MKLSAITNKHLEGQWFDYAGVLRVKLKYGQGLRQKLSSAIVEFATKASEAVDSSDTSVMEQAEKESRGLILKVICEDHFIDFEPSNDEQLTDDDGNEIENTLANRMMILDNATELYDFVDLRISNYEFWT